MSRYTPLFELKIDHRFMIEQPCPALHLELDMASQPRLNRAGLLIRHSGGWLQVLHDESRSDVLAALMAEEPLILGWRMRSSDPSLAGCSEPPLMQIGRVLYLESSDAYPHGMHAGEFVAESDFIGLSDKRLKAFFTPGDLLLPPLAFVVVRISDLEPRHYRIRLETLRSYWRYRVLGELDENAATVVDADGTVEFKSLGRAQLGGGRSAATFLSSETLPLRLRGGPRFALHPSSLGSSRAIIERLPLASIANTRRESIEGEERRVSDIYVNL